MSPRHLVLLAAAAALLYAPPLSADESIDARIRHAGGRLAAEGSIEVQVELRWQGRPELHAPSAPSIELPEGASHALGRTGSDFDGTSTRWWSNIQVELPGEAGPWTLGPATVLVRSRGPIQTITAAAIELGARPLWKTLWGQGLGSGLVVLFVVGWVGFRLRTLARDERGERSVDRQATQLLEGTQGLPPEEAWERLIEVRLALEAEAVDNATLPAAEALRERLERSRFGGESLTETECRELRRQIENLLES